MVQQLLARIQNNTTLLLILVVGAVWLTSIVWVAKDSTQRTDSIALHAIYIMMVTFLTPLIGVPLYMIVRPVSLQKDKLPRRESLVFTNIPCASCSMMNLQHHQHCVFCGSSLTHNCKECHQAYPQHYDFCLHCGAPNIDAPEE